jgi:hypothetical protein
VSNRKRNYQCIGGGISYKGVARERVCDGKRHFDRYSRPKSSYYVGRCDCKEFFDAIEAIFTSPYLPEMLAADRILISPEAAKIMRELT